MARGAEALTIVPPDASQIDADLFHLRLLATTDLHVHLVPWDYYGNRSAASSGLARTATLIAAARAEIAARQGLCLLLDNGDFLNGSPLGDLVAGAPDPATATHPMIAAMNALGYDAATLGNHEFSEGLEFLMSCIGAAQFPIVSANIARSLGDTPLADRMLVPATALLQRDLPGRNGSTHSLKIGIIGFLPPQTTQWDQRQLGGSLVTRDILDAAAAHVPRLRAAGADIVIALSHSGIGSATGGPGMENAAAALAALPGIDALVAGHAHQTFPSADFPLGPGIDPVRGTLWGKPAVMPGFHGSHLGVVDLTLTHCAGVWRVQSGAVALRPIARRNRAGRVVAVTRSAAGILDIAGPAHRATRTWSRQAIGHTDTALHSYFALAAPCPAVTLVAEAQAAHVARVLQGGPHAGLPVISAAAPYHAGGRGGPESYALIPPGPIALRHAFDLFPHPDSIAALLVTGSDLQRWVERSFSLYHQIAAGSQDAPLVNPDFPGFNFDQIAGLTWLVDLTQPARCDTRGSVINPASQRIRDLRHLGRPIDPAARFVLATNSYRAAGSGGFAAATSDRVILNGPHYIRDILLAHMAGGATLSDRPPPNWRFTPTPDTTVIFESAPAAVAHIAELSSMTPEALDLTPRGFRRFRLHL